MSFADALNTDGVVSRTLRLGEVTIRFVSSDRPISHSKTSLGISREPVALGIPVSYRIYCKQRKKRVSNHGAHIKSWMSIEE